MAEEKDLSIDMVGYEAAKHNSYIISQGKAANKAETINLDVHALSELQDKKVPPTDDSCKYRYKAQSTDPRAEYEFEGCSGKVIALRFNNQFVDQVTSGQECGVLLDKTNFYAESGGQIYDQGYMVKVGDESTEFSIQLVYNKGG